MSPSRIIEHSLAAYFLGVTFGQAIVGPLSDRFGRRLPLLVGLGLYVLGSAACALAHDPLSLDIARFVTSHGRLRRGGPGTRLCARHFSAPSGGAHLRPDAAGAVGIALVRASVRRLAASGGELALCCSGFRARMRADRADGVPAPARKPSRLGSRHSSRCGGARLLGHRPRPPLSGLCDGFDFVELRASMSISPAGRMW